MPQPIPHRLCQKQLARRWNMSHRTLERWRARNDGPPYLKLLGKVLYRLEDIEQFEAERLHAGHRAEYASR